MVERRVIVRLPLGLHARPAAELAALASRFVAEVQLVRDSIAVNAKSTLGLISLAAEPGAELVIRAVGTDAAEAVEQIAAFLERPDEG